MIELADAAAAGVSARCVKVLGGAGENPFAVILILFVGNRVLCFWWWLWTEKFNNFVNRCYISRFSN